MKIYQGEFASRAAFAAHLAEEIDAVASMPDWLAEHFTVESFANELFTARYTSQKAANGGIHVYFKLM